MQTGRTITDGNALEALFPGTRRSIFCTLFGEPDRWWSLSELAGRAGLRPGSLRQHVSRLRDGGILQEKRLAGCPLFRPDPSSPVFSELQSMVAKLSATTPHTETILIVEDQPATAQITRILLESWGYQVLEVHGAREAIQMFEDHRDAIGLLLFDVVMPEMNGPQLADELLRRRPDLRVIFMSGAPNQELVRKDAAFLPKPFNPVSLSRIVRQELDRRFA